MSTTFYSATLNKKSKIDQKSIHRWFWNLGFELVRFQNSRFKIMTDELSHIIEEKENFNTYYKEDVGGSIIVFEIGISNGVIECIGYCPITLFGFYKMKVSFKEKSSVMTKYRQSGYEYLSEFKNYINSK